MTRVRGYMSNLLERMQAGKASVGRTNGFPGEPTGDKTVCDDACLCRYKVQVVSPFLFLFCFLIP